MLDVGQDYNARFFKHLPKFIRCPEFSSPPWKVLPIRC